MQRVCNVSSYIKKYKTAVCALKSLQTEICGTIALSVVLQAGECETMPLT
jgi:hypothetical protein